MTAPNESRVAHASLPKRDWILLPLISLLTISLILISLALTAERMFPNPVQPGRPTLASCLVLDDPSTGVRATPNCQGWAGVYESGPALYKFNSCGHRAGV